MSLLRLHEQVTAGEPEDELVEGDEPDEELDEEELAVAEHIPFEQFGHLVNKASFLNPLQKYSTCLQLSPLQVSTMFPLASAHLS